MRALKHPGKCKLCGQFKELSSEHIPPKKAFNSNNVMVLPFCEIVKMLSGEGERLPWDVTGLRGSLHQGGYKKYCLCHSCNNNTGQWYMRAYTDLAKTFHEIIVSKLFSVGNSYSFEIRDLYPLRIYKAMMTMICDINDNCLGDDNLRQFLLNKDAVNVDLSKYSLYIYLVSTQMPRIWEMSGIFNIYNPKESVIVSEIALYPIGFALYINKPKSYNPFGLNVDDFALLDYEKKSDVQFYGIPYIDINSQFPVDYRSKEDIIKC